jgi:PPP family 3-phenylpropionic acid transporter
LTSPVRSYLLISAHYFFAFAALGVFFPYFALFLRENVGLTNGQVGMVISIPPLVGLFAQPAWGQVADRTGSRVRVLVFLCLGAAAGFAALSHAQGLAATILATFGLSLFLSALYPLAVSVAFGVLPSSSLFGRVRVWGTIGYFIVVVSAPLLLARARAWLDVGAGVPGGASEPGLELLFYLAAACLVLAALGVGLLPKHAGLSAQARRGDLRALLSERAFARVLLFSTGIQFFLHGPMQLFPLYVRSRGGTMTDLSHLWICMLLLEVPLIFGSSWLFARFGVKRMMLAAAIGGGVRWVVCALVPTLAGVYPVQALHALVVTGLNVGTALYVERIVPQRLRSTAQSTVVMVGSSIGGVLSATLGGFVVDRWGVDVLFLAGGAGALCWVLGAGRLLETPSASVLAASAARVGSSAE